MKNTNIFKVLLIISISPDFAYSMMHIPTSPTEAYNIMNIPENASENKIEAFEMLNNQELTNTQSDTIFDHWHNSYCHKDDDKSLIGAILARKSHSVIADLIHNGADVNETESEFLHYFIPVLGFALDRGTDKESVEIIKELIKAKANVNAEIYNRVSDENLYGMMPLLTYATIYSSPEVVQLLINAGAKDCIPDQTSPIQFKKSALMIANELGKKDTARILELSFF